MLSRIACAAGFPSTWIRTPCWSVRVLRRAVASAAGTVLSSRASKRVSSTDGGTLGLAVSAAVWRWASSVVARAAAGLGPLSLHALSNGIAQASHQDLFMVVLDL